MTLIDLRNHEANGGHTIGRHVGKSEAYLRHRLAVMPTIPAATSFDDLAAAGRLVTAAVANSVALAGWLQNPHAPLIQFDYDPAVRTGYGIVQGNAAVGLLTMSRLRVVLVKQPVPPEPFLVLTAFPVL